MIVGLCGAIGAGKTAAARQLSARYGFVRVRFAGPLKDMLRALGLAEEDVDGGLKDRPCALLGGRTPRHAMQTLGTEWGRQCVDKNLWVRAWRAQTERYDNVVADDVRFPNEVAEIKNLGGVVLRVTRPGSCTAAEAAAHASEQADLDVDGEVINDSDIAALGAKLAPWARLAVPPIGASLRRDIWQ